MIRNPVVAGFGGGGGNIEWHTETGNNINLQVENDICKITALKPTGEFTVYGLYNKATNAFYLPVKIYNNSSTSQSIFVTGTTQKRCLLGAKGLDPTNIYIFLIYEGGGYLELDSNERGTIFGATTNPSNIS